METSGSFWQYYKDEASLDNNNNIIHFPANKNIQFKFKEKIRMQTGNDGTKDVEIIVPLKYLNDFWNTLEMALVNCEINFILSCSANCFLVAGTMANQVATFARTDTKLHVPVITLLTQDNAKLLEQLKSGFKRTINWN